MFYLLYEWLHGAATQSDAFRYVRVLQYVTFRTIFAALTAFFLAAYLGPFAIRRLKAIGARDRSHTTDPPDIVKTREAKQGTPTMGGILILFAILTSVLFWGDLANYYVFVGIFVTLWLGILGFIDDYTKLTNLKKDGLRPRTKFLFQIGLGLLVGLFLWRYAGRLPPGTDAQKFALLFTKHLVPLGAGVFILLAVLVIVGTSNAVNLTDGLDGLAIGTTIMSALAITGLAYVAGNREFSRYLFVPYVRGADELTVMGGALVGASLGFLYWNCHPAEVFMGDTGSLAIGGLIGYLAFAIRQELLLLIAGGVFVIEAGSVILQVGYFKYTRRRYGEGRRLFLRAPYHHHLQRKGWHENQVTVRFWILASLFAGLAIATLKLR